MSREHDDVPRARASLPLRRLPTAGARLWLVRSGAVETAPAIGLVLLNVLPRLLDAFGAGACGRG